MENGASTSAHIPWDRAAAGRCLRPAEPADAADLAALYVSVFKRPMTAAQWRWKYGRGQPTSWLAESDGELLGHYGGRAEPWWLPGQSALVVVATDGMTATAARRAGLLGSLRTRAHRAWREQGAALVVGLPNEHWGVGRGALAWDPLFQLEWLVRPLQPERLLARRAGVWLRALAPLGRLWDAAWDRQLPSDATLRVVPATQGGDELHELVARFTSDVGPAVPPAPGRLPRTLGPVRSAERLLWRYREPAPRPHDLLVAWRAARPVGYVALRVESHADARSGYIGEMAWDPGDPPTFAALLRAALGGLRRAGAEAAYLLRPQDAAGWRELRRAGFLRRRHGFCVSATALDPDLDLRTLRASRDSDLWGGDFDVI